MASCDGLFFIILGFSSRHVLISLSLIALKFRMEVLKNGRYKNVIRVKAGIVWSLISSVCNVLKFWELCKMSEPCFKKLLINGVKRVFLWLSGTGLD
jgi:hypothetical protein